MSCQDLSVSSKTPNGKTCSTSALPPYSSNKGVPLTEEKRNIAEAAKQTALEILRDALRKKDRVLMERPQDLFFSDCGDPRFWMERHAVLTEELVTSLIAELEAVKFKEDLTRESCYAYVYSKSRDKTVYLCPPFWKSSTKLGEYSQPGILIHEVSHFLGTRDISYSKASIYVACRGKLVESSPDHPVPDLNPLEKAVLNANNIMYEFEITLKHKGKYENGQYSCCGEKAENSVCERAVPDQFLIHGFRESCSVRQDIDEILKWSLLPARDRLKSLLAELLEIADTLDKIHRGATIAKITGGSVGIAGGITAIVGLALAPVTFGASLIVSITGLAVSTAGGLTSAAATATDMGTTHVKKETTEKLLKECQEELEHIERHTNSICEKFQHLEGFGGKDFMSAVTQIGSGTGRVVLNTMKIVKAGQLLANAGRIARFAGAVTGVLTALALVFDIFFVAKDSMEYHKGAKSELAGKIREAVNKMEQVICLIDQFCRELTSDKQE
ncbi:uncharacterized protein [Emydura macquarii macquarii]|uniref:uncharacterized protein n=1 Tax=Emydura macquarii macquarii TaxID=1129001 RepID=UPI00352A7CD5